MSREVGIVIPAYRPNVETTAAYVRSIADTIAPSVVRIELDDPRSKTVGALGALDGSVGEDTTVELNAVDRRRGKGAAITAGFEALDVDVLAFADDDGSTLSPSFGRVVEAVRTGRTDLAYATRYHPESWVHESTHRHLNGRLFAWTARRLLPLDSSDYQCGAKAIDREAWRDVRSHLIEPGFAWDIELLSLTHALGYRVDSIPVTWVHNPRSRAESVSTAGELLRSLVTVRHRSKRLRGNPLHVAIGDRRAPRRPLVETGIPLGRDE